MMRFPPVAHKTVLITGCSSGIGLATARMLAKSGWDVIPTARSDSDLEMLEGLGFLPMRLDMSDDASVARAAEEVHDRLNGRLGALVNNAGYGQVGAVEDLSRDTLRRQFEVNVFGMQQLTNRCIPVFRQQGFGRIINVSSVYGRVVGPLMGSYCASKYAMEALSDAMRAELWGSGVAVVLVEPGPIITSFRDNVVREAENALDLDSAHFTDRYSSEIKRRKGKKKTKKPDFFNKPPEAVGAVIQKALESSKPKARYCVTPAAYFGAFMRRFAPTSWMDRLVAKQVHKN